MSCRISFVSLLVGLLMTVVMSHPSIADEGTAPLINKDGYLDSIPLDLVDKNFDKVVDLAKLQTSIRNLDCSALADQLLQLVNEEKRIGKKHESISSKALLELLFRGIVETRDDKALETIAGSLDKLEVEDLKLIVEQTQKLLASPRKVDLGPGVRLGEVSTEAIVVYGSLKEQIRVAKVVGDIVVLQQLRKHAVALKVLHPKQRAYLAQFADEAIAAVPNDRKNEQAALSRLTGFSNRSGNSTNPK